MFKYIILLICLLLKCTFNCAQVVMKDINLERNFAFQVKQIDEFMDRFNDNENSLIKEYIRENYPGTEVNRKSLVRSLFDKSSLILKTEEVNEFSNHVIDSLQPIWLDFVDDRWFAEVICKFRYGASTIDAKLIMQVSRADNGGIKWLIIGASSPKIKNTQKTGDLVAVRQVRKFLSPVSHATDFVGLSRAFSDNANIRDYLGNSFYNHIASLDFLRAVLNGELEFQYIKSINYHFLQVKGWIFIVKYFERRSANSGWLISNLRKSSDQEKELYKSKLLK